MVIPVEIPCPIIPDVPEKLEIPLPFGGAIQAFHDFSQGIPDDCTLVNNLLLQFNPMLGGLTCIIKILDTLVAVKEWLEGAVGPPPDPMALATGAVDVIDKLGELAPCFLMVTPAGICPMIKGVLEAIIKMLKCVISAVQSVLDFQIGIDLSAAEGNPVLLANLQCAQDNSQVSLQHALAALEPIEPLFKLLDPLLSIAGVSLETPPLGDIAALENVNEAIEQLEGVVTTLDEVVGALPC